MPNPNRTTKPERRAARRAAPRICRLMGTAEAARLARQGVSDDATAFDRLMHALDIPPGMLGDGAGMHWSDYRNCAKTEDGRVVYIDPATYARVSQDLIEQMKPIIEAQLDTELTAAGLGPDDYRIAYPDPVVEVAADSPEVPEPIRPAVEAAIRDREGEAGDYMVVYRASAITADRAEFLIYPAGTWQTGGVLEDYARLHGHHTPDTDYRAQFVEDYPLRDLTGVAPVGAPPFNIELFELQHAPETEQGHAARQQLRGAGTLHIPQQMLPAAGIDTDAADELRRTIAAACDEPAAVPPIVVAPAEPEADDEQP